VTVVDTSAIIATIADEDDCDRFRQVMREAESLEISSVTVLETRIVLFSRLGIAAVDLFNEFLEKSGIQVVAFDGEMASAAFEAFRRFGKGQGHPAQLNIVDCAAYALAMVRSQPLLLKGDDFAHTDIRPALA
jgi:ribonuclease VapC